MTLSSDLKVSIKISCPLCSKRGEIRIEENIVDHSDRGITAVNVAENLICPHSFVAYIDRNLVVRDSFTCDFTVPLPEMEIISDPSLKSIEFDIEIIKYNLLPNLLSNIIKGMLSSQKIVIINNLDNLNDQYYRFLNYILDGIFKLDLSFLHEAEFKNNKKQYKSSVVLKGVNVITDKKKKLISKKWKIINSIVQRFYVEFDSQTAIILIKSDLTKLFKLSEDLITLNSSLDENEDLTSKLALDYLNDKYKTKIHFGYLTLLMNIVDEYFQIKLKKPPSSADLLGYKI